MAVPVPHNCSWLCAHAYLESGESPRRGLSEDCHESLRCRIRWQGDHTCTCPNPPFAAHCAHHCNGTRCGGFEPAINCAWLKGEECKKVPKCEHDWYLVGVHMPSMVMWCSRCGSIMTTNKRESERVRSLKTLWNFKCRHNPKMPRALLEPLGGEKMSEAEAEVRRLLSAIAKKQGIISLSKDDLEAVGIAPDVTITKTKKLKLTVIKAKEV